MGQRPVPEDRSGKRKKGKERDRETEKEMGGGRGPLKRDRSQSAQEVLPVAAAEVLLGPQGQASTDA